MSTKVTFTKQAEWVPLPTTERGFGIHLGTHHKKRLLAYASNKSIVVRSVDDPAEATVYSGHKSPATVAKFSPNGEWVCSGDSTGEVQVWGVKNHIVKNTVRANRKILDIAWSDDGKRIVVVGDGAEAKAKVFPWDSGSNLGEIKLHTKPILTCDFKPSRPYRVVTGGEDNLVGFFAGPPFKFVSSNREHTRYPNCVRYSPDGAHYVSVGADRQILIFDGKEGTKVGAIEAKEDEAHSGSIFSVAWSPDGKRLLTASADKTARVWDFETRALLQKHVIGAEVDDMQVAAAFCGETMVTVSLSGAINVLDPENPAAPARVIHGAASRVHCAAADPAAGKVYTGDAAGRLTSWDRATGQPTWFSGAGAAGKGVLGVAVTAGGAHVATVSADDRLRFNECKTAEWSAGAVDLGGRPNAVAASPDDGELVAVTLGKGEVLLARPSGVVARVDVKFKPLSVAIRPGSGEVAVGGDDKLTHVYTVNGDELAEAGTYKSVGKVESVAYSGDGAVLYSGCSSRTLLARDAANGYADLNGGHRWSFHNASVLSIAPGPAGTDLVVTGAADQGFTAFPKASEYSMSHSRHEGAHTGFVTFVAFWDDNTLVSAGKDDTVRFWTIA